MKLDARFKLGIRWDIPSILQIAIAADRLTSGRGKLFATHATIIWYAETDPRGIKNIAKNLAPVFKVEMTMMLPINEMESRQMM